jgi:alanyl-tRNA synthetase
MLKMSTKLSYFEDTYKFNELAVITATGRDEIGLFVLLDQTIFYPQGGGQPSDTGTMDSGHIAIPVHFVKCVGSEVRHYTDKDYDQMVGTQVLCSIDPEKRLKHARLHSAGHFISSVVEILYPDWQAIKGHHFPDQCYIEFSSQSNSPEDISVELIMKEIEAFIKMDCKITQKQITGDQLQELCPNLPYAVPQDKQVRIVRMGDFPFTPCGGTHIKSLKELGNLEITKYKIKAKCMKISYRI